MTTSQGSPPRGQEWAGWDLGASLEDSCPIPLHTPSPVVRVLWPQVLCCSR
jgi:hypothetical protein